MPRYCNNIDYSMNRRDFLGRFGLGMGGVALMGLLNRDVVNAAASVVSSSEPNAFRGVLNAPHLAPKWEQDQLASKLWNGGTGRGNWEC